VCVRSRSTDCLTNAANVGVLRLFCAQHVLDEVVEHSASWTEGTAVTRSIVLRRWLTEYLPQIRVLQADDLPDGLLTPDEKGRIDQLQLDDTDDVPSAALALLLGAFYLTRDGDALGQSTDPELTCRSMPSGETCVELAETPGSWAVYSRSQSNSRSLLEAGYSVD
jgi:hypothetical protein